MGTYRRVNHLYATWMAWILTLGSTSRYLADISTRHQFYSHLAPSGWQVHASVCALLQAAPFALHHQRIHLLVFGYPSMS